MKFLKEWGLFILIVAIIVVLRFFVFKPVLVDGHSMDPTLADRERLMITTLSTIKRQDIVIAKEYDSTSDKPKKIVKRVIGLPGDTITYHNDVLTVNGKVVKEPYLADYQAQLKKDKLQSTYQYDAFFQRLARQSTAFTTSATGEANFTVKVPEGQYYLMGDDRIVSQDSRRVGRFPKKDIIGEAKVRFWPLNRIGGV